MPDYILWKISLWLIIAAIWMASSMLSFMGIPLLGDVGHGKVICVYPISGQYGLMPRVLFYLTLAFGALFENHEWLVLGAISSALTFAGATAVHAFVLLCSIGIPDEPAMDLDIIACATILFPCITMGSILGTHSARFRTKKMKTIIISWTALTALGAMFSIILIGTSEPKSQYPCQTPDGITLRAPGDYQPGQHNCTYTCFSEPKSLRELSDVRAIDNDFFRRLFLLLPASVAQSLTIMGLAMIMRYRRASRNGTSGPSTLWPIAPCVASFVFVAVMEVAVIGQIGLIPAEMALPVGERAFAVGQWAPWVVVALLVTTALLHRVLPEEALESIEFTEQHTVTLEQQIAEVRSRIDRD